jgi:hypothetical protein
MSLVTHGTIELFTFFHGGESLQALESTIGEFSLGAKSEERNRKHLMGLAGSLYATSVGPIAGIDISKQGPTGRKIGVATRISDCLRSFDDDRRRASEATLASLYPGDRADRPAAEMEIERQRARERDRAREGGG